MASRLVAKRIYPLDIINRVCYFIDMKNNSDTPKIILASKSPRRKYLLEQAGIQFTVIPSDIDESKIPVSKPSEYVQTLAEAKANEISRSYPEKVIIGADTIVVIDGTILGKPKSKDQAREMLKKLSGQTHQVFTGFSIQCRETEEVYSATVKTDVIFKDLTSKEIEWYINTNEPFDKAGSYAIQGLGTFLVKKINGSYTNVVGLPVCEVIEILIEKEIIGFKIGHHGYYDQ